MASGERGHHSDDGDQGNEHVQQVGVQAAGLKASGDRHDRHEQPVHVGLYHLHDIGGVPEVSGAAANGRLYIFRVIL